MEKFNPFMNLDATKAFGDFRLPEMNVEGFLSSQRKNLETATVLSQLAFEGLQSATKCQAELAKSCVESYTKGAEAIAEAKSPEETATKQADLVESLFEEAVTDLNELTSLTRKSANAIFHVVEQRFTEGLDEFRTAVKPNGKAPAAKAPAAKTPAKAAK